jgi:hypothetical protein
MKPDRIRSLILHPAAPIVCYLAMLGLMLVFQTIIAIL